MTFGRSPKKRALKVGYTGDLKSRNESYYLHNPFIEKISFRLGDKILEKKLQLYLWVLGYKEKFLNEWFINDPEVLQRFHDSIERINKTLWKNRDSVWSESDFTGSEPSRKRQIYEELRMIYGEPKYETKADRAWKLDFNKKLLKSMKSQDWILNS